MDMNKYAETGLNVTFVKNSPSKRLVILNGGQPKIMVDGKEKVSFLCEIDGVQAQYMPNKTTIKNLVNNWGADSLKWIGRPVNLQIETIQGKEAVVGKP